MTEYVEAGAIIGTVRRVAPNWCLLSSAHQFENGIPKSLILPGISQARTVAA